MKKLLPFLFFILFSGVLFAQTFPLVTIEDIQYLPDSVLINSGDQPSPLDGDTVQVKGVVMVRPVVDPQLDRRPIMWAGARWQIYIYDPDGQQYDNFDGMIIIQDDTSEAFQGTFFDLVDTAQVVTFTAVVSEFFTTTQGQLLLNPISPVSIDTVLSKRPDPIELNISDFMDNGTLNPLSEKYEGEYVIVRNVVSSDRNLGDGSFRINDGQGNFMTIGDQSGYFTLRSNHRLTGLTDYQPPVDGTTINFVRGVIQTRTTGYYIMPMYPGDINISATPPAISEIRRSSAEVMTNQPVDITAKIVDFDGFVQSAKMFYRIDGGTYNEVQLLQNPSDTTKYTGTIPAIASDSSLVDFFIWAQDNENRIATMPADTSSPVNFFLVLNRNVTIQDVQYNPFGTDISGYNGYRVDLTGTISADTTDFPGGQVMALRVYMQNGEGPWSGIRIGTNGNMGNDVLNLRKGDNVTISGYIWDGSAAPTFNVTRIDSVTQITINSTGNSLPAFKDLETGTIGLGGNGSVAKEQWESVLIKYNSVLVTDENADGPPNNFGEMLVDDGSGDTRVELEDGNHDYHNLSDPTRLYYVRTGSTFDALSGLLYYSFGNYKLVPRNDDDFVGFVSDVKGEKDVPTEYSLSQNYPNPFNPSTTIEYALPEGGDVSLRIFNLLGQEVRIIFDNDFQSAGTHRVVFDASSLPSGIYFYQFRTKNFVKVKKMILMK